MKSTCIPAKKKKKKRGCERTRAVHPSEPAEHVWSSHTIGFYADVQVDWCHVSVWLLLRPVRAHMCWGRLQPKLSSRFQEPCTPTLHMSCAMRNAANRLGVPVRELEFLHNTMMCYTLNFSLFSNNYRESI